jgi:hypothetical protein
MPVEVSLLNGATFSIKFQEWFFKPEPIALQMTPLLANSFGFDSIFSFRSRDESIWGNCSLLGRGFLSFFG